MIYIKQKGRAEKGSAFKGQATYHFNGNLLFKVDYFKQALPELFLQVCTYTWENNLSHDMTKPTK